LDSKLPPEEAFKSIEQIGGQQGWYYADGLWKLRGALDLLLGGVGLRRGSRDPLHVRVGDTIDCWRVEAIEPHRRLRLFAEMNLPGRAWLEFEVEPTPNGSQVRQTATFDPVGLSGLAYWYLVYPLHRIVFKGMLRGIVEAAHLMAVPDPRPWNPSWIRQTAWLIGLVALCLSAAGVGGLITSMTVGNWYQALAKPVWTPPDWVFGPVWTLLYLLMALAAWLVWRRAGWPAARIPLAWFALQLALNISWSALFFGLRSPGLAALEIIGLWLAIAATVIAFWGRSTAAALLLLPYLFWTLFALALNFRIWQLNW
jgi:tryptophan-rich sensory protein